MINNSTSILPDTRLDLHTLFTDGDFISSQLAVCSQLQHSVLVIFTSLPESDSVISEVLNTWHIPHFSSSLVSRLEAARQPYNLHLGPSLDWLTSSVESVVRTLVRPGESVAVITHHTGQLQLTQLLSSLQSSNISVQLELLQADEIRPKLSAVRRSQLRTVVVDISSALIIPFLQRALQVALLQPNTRILFTALDFPPVSALDFVMMTEVTLMSYSLMEDPGQKEEYREFLLRTSLEMLTSTISSMSELPTIERLNCSDPEKVSSHGKDLLQQLRPHQPPDLHLMVRREGSERRAAVFTAATQTLRLLENLTMEETREETEKPVKLHVLVWPCISNTEFCIITYLQDQREISNILTLLEDLTEVRVDLIQGGRVSSVPTLMAGCEVVVCNSSQLVNIVNTQGLDFPPIFTNISTTPSASLPINSHLHYLMGFLVSFIMTVLCLALASHTSTNLECRFSVLDSSWVVSTATFLSIQHGRLLSASTRILVLGWTLFSASYLVYYLGDSVLPGLRQTEQSNLYLLGNRDCTQVSRIVGATLRAANITNNETKTLTNLPMLPHIGLGAILCISLIASFLEMLVKKCERREKRESDSREEDTAGSEQKLLNWQHKPTVGRSA